MKRFTPPVSGTTVALIFASFLVTGCWGRRAACIAREVGTAVTVDIGYQLSKDAFNSSQGNQPGDPHPTIENVVVHKSGSGWQPAPGRAWLKPDDQSDLRTRTQ